MDGHQQAYHDFAFPSSSSNPPFPTSLQPQPPQSLQPTSQQPQFPYFTQPQQQYDMSGFNFPSAPPAQQQQAQQQQQQFGPFAPPQQQGTQGGQYAPGPPGMTLTGGAPSMSGMGSLGLGGGAGIGGVGGIGVGGAGLGAGVGGTGVGVGVGGGGTGNPSAGNVTQSTGLPGGQRRRPKYTRSKAGCLTCRQKKIKCDELHPICTRCLQSHRECVWPPDTPHRRSKPSSQPGSTPGTPPSRPHPYATGRAGHARHHSQGHLVPGGAASRSHSPPSGAESGASLGVPSPATSGSAPGSSERRVSPMLGQGGFQPPMYGTGEYDPNVHHLLEAMQHQNLAQPRPPASSSQASPEMPPLPASSSTTTAGTTTTTTASSSTGMPPTPPQGMPGSAQNWWATGLPLLPSPQIHNTNLVFPTVDGEWWGAEQVFNAGEGWSPDKEQPPSGAQQQQQQQQPAGADGQAQNNNGQGQLIPTTTSSQTQQPPTDLSALISLYPHPPTNAPLSPSSLFPPYGFGNATSPPLLPPGQPYPLAPAQNPLSPLGNLSPPPLDASFVAQLQALQGLAPYGPASVTPAQGQWGNTLSSPNGRSASNVIGALEGPSGLNGGSISVPNNTNGDLGQPLMAGPDPFEPYFQTVEERNLIRHYCQTATKIIMAVPSDLNPVLAINLPLVFEHPPGQNSATEALRLSLLGVGAIHQAYLLSRHGVNSASQQEMMNLAVTLRLTATHYLRMACLSPQGMESDAALGASITIALIDIFTGGQNWTANLALAKTLVDLRGGPRTIIATNKPHLIDGGAKVSPARLLLEILAVYDTFGSLTTGEPPTILAPGSEDWWFDGDKSSYHLFSVEKVFGMSRAMIELVARVSCLAARANKHRRKIVELEEAQDGRSPAQQEEYERQAIESEAMALYEEAKTWNNSALKHRLHPRVEYGNTAHRQAMQVILLRDVLRVDRKDPRVQEAVQSILKICTDSAKRLGMGVDLTWPVIVAGCQVEKEDRDKVLKAFESFREQCCFDIDTAERIVREVWKRLDKNPNDPRADWRSVTEDLDLKVLLL